MSLYRAIRSVAGSLVWLLLLLLAFAIPLSQPWSARITAAAVLLSFLVKQKGYFFSRFAFYGWDVALYVFLLFIGALYSADVEAGLKITETNLSLLALPLAFARVGDMSKERAQQIIRFFCSGLFLSSLICLLHAYCAYEQTGVKNAFFFQRLTEVIQFQPTYYAYYLIFAITCALYTLYYRPMQASNVWPILAALFFSFMLLLVGGWTAMTSLFFVLSFFVLKYLLEEKTSSRSIAFGIAVVILTSLLSLDRLASFSKDGVLQNDYWERSALWKSAINANTNPIFGMGTGDSRKALDEYYTAHGMQDFADKNYNSHNQFTQSYLGGGALGLAALFLLLMRPLYLSVRSGKTILALVFFPFIVYGVTEAFFGRYQGVVFFAFLHQVFISYLYPFKHKTPAITSNGSRNYF